MLVGVEYVAVLFAQTVVKPLTTGVGFALMVTEYAAVVALQPVAVTESLTVKLPLPALAQFTLILAVPCPLDMVPPVIVHK